MLILERPWTRQPPAGTRAGRYPGLRNLYHFAGGADQCLITGAKMVMPAQPLAVTRSATFITVDSLGWVTTPATLPLAFHAVAPITIIVGYKQTSSDGSQIPWSLMNPIWDGWYVDGAAGVNIKSTNNTDFSGALTPTAGPVVDPSVYYVAVTMSGTNDLRASYGGGPVALDSACAAPTPTSPNSSFLLGGNGAPGNRCTTRCAYVALLDRSVPDSELRSLSANPWQLFAPRRIYIPTAAAAGYTHPTLSLATATEITATGFKPRVTYTFA